jgi:hypothetical protein
MDKHERKIKFDEYEFFKKHHTEISEKETEMR